MRETVFKKALSLLLCAVLILGVLPLDSHAAGYQVNGQSITWYFPLPEEFFDDIEDFAGCRGANENSLYGTPNLGCTHADHAELPYGSEAMIVNVSDTQPVYAPAQRIGSVLRAGHALRKQQRHRCRYDHRRDQHLCRAAPPGAEGALIALSRRQQHSGSSASLSRRPVSAAAHTAGV